MMMPYLENLLRALRPAFSRRATFVWFVLVFVGFLTRSDIYGVSSIVRALWLAPACYPCLLHFFHSSAWRTATLRARWWQWLAQQSPAHRLGERMVLLGDHTKNVKDGRRMPEATTLHQDSETGSKPAFFRGHHWGCLCLLMRAGGRSFAAPLWAEIHRAELEESRATRIVSMAAAIAQAMGREAYLVLDAFFAVGPVFERAALEQGRLHILTRAKKTVTAYRRPKPPKKPKPGRPRIYGKKLKLIRLFDAWPDQFQTAQAVVYHNMETVRYLTLDLLWKPVKGPLRFLLIESSRGRIILMTSDLTLEPLRALELYCRRVSIETLFDTLKNLLGGLHYHFWSKYLSPASRRPAKKGTPRPVSSRPEKTKNTLAAIEKFVIVQLLVLGALQLLACRFARQIGERAHCWLRTPCGEIPSEFVTRTALANIIRRNLCALAKDWITQLILPKQNTIENTGYFEEAA